MRESVFYSLNEQDIQTVAEQEIGRHLSKEELDVIKHDAASLIDWYEPIAQAINSAKHNGRITVR